MFHEIRFRSCTNDSARHRVDWREILFFFLSFVSTGSSDCRWWVPNGFGGNPRLHNPKKIKPILSHNRTINHNQPTWSVPSWKRCRSRTNRCRFFCCCCNKRNRRKKKANAIKWSSTVDVASTAMMRGVLAENSRTQIGGVNLFFFLLSKEQHIESGTKVIANTLTASLAHRSKLFRLQFEAILTRKTGTAIIAPHWYIEQETKPAF